MKSNTLAHEWFEEVWNKSQINAIDRLLADDAIAHGLFDEHGQELRGPAGFNLSFSNSQRGFRTFMSRLWKPFPKETKSLPDAL